MTTAAASRLFDRIAFVSNRRGQCMTRRFALHIDATAAAVNGHHGVRIDALDGASNSGLTMAAGHTLYVECVLHNGSPVACC